MSCYNPRCAIVPLQGGSPIFIHGRLNKGSFFSPSHGPCRVVYIPCGHCMACRTERRQDLTALQMLEASLHDDNWFLTLTYDDWLTYQLTETFPHSLVKEHLSTFVESMRKYCRYHHSSFRFFACGEYGDLTQRPHYHLSIFGLSPDLLGISDDPITTKQRSKELYANSRLACTKNALTDQNGEFVYSSPIISSRWKFGNHKLYRANRQTFQYVAGYVTKKLSGAPARAFQDTGRILPFSAQSRPSIGYPWFERYHQTLSNYDRNKKKLVNDLISVGDLTWRLPRIFDRWYSRLYQFDYPIIRDFQKELRSSQFPDVPNFEDLQRKKNFDRYRADQFKQQQLNKGSI